MGRGAEHEAKDWTWAVGWNMRRRTGHRPLGRTRGEGRNIGRRAKRVLTRAPTSSMLLSDSEVHSASVA